MALLSLSSATSTYWTLPQASAVPLSPPEAVLAWGRTLVIAPHPDDEALGCGGAIALLTSYGIPVEVAVMTDGRGSHPHSRAYPPERLIPLRQAELLESTAKLGVPRPAVHFFSLPDAAMPPLHTPAAEEAIQNLRELIHDFETVLVTWHGDPHCDHQTSAQYAEAAVRGLPTRLLEYPVWVWQNGAPEDAPSHDEYRFVRLNISRVLPRKLAAIHAHRSQVSPLITDDPDGFNVPPEMLAHFAQPWELFIERVC